MHVTAIYLNLMDNLTITQYTCFLILSESKLYILKITLRVNVLMILLN